MKRKKKEVPSAQQLIEIHAKFHPREEMPVKSGEIVPVTETAIIPSAPSANLETMIERLVRRRVDEVLSRMGIEEFDPHFRPREIAAKSRQVENMFEREKWSLYFEKWGCQVCGRKSDSHMHTGHCAVCANRIQTRLGRLKREYERAHPEAETDRLIDNLTLRARTAERLFRGDE